MFRLDTLHAAVLEGRAKLSGPLLLRLPIQLLHNTTASPCKLQQDVQDPL